MHRHQKYGVYDASSLTMYGINTSLWNENMKNGNREGLWSEMDKYNLILMEYVNFSEITKCKLWMILEFCYEDEWNSILMEYVNFNNITIFMKLYWVIDTWDLKR